MQAWWSRHHLLLIADRSSLTLEGASQARSLRPRRRRDRQWTGSCVEKANPETLYGIFGDAAWTNKYRLPDSLLPDLLEHFSRISLGNEAAQTDILGQSYEYLIKKFRRSHK